MEKRIRIMKEEEDRISSLPDCLLIDIISLLPETKEAIRTGTLSKRWKTVWTEIHNLTFVYSDPEYIDKTLTQCSSQSNLNTFRLHTTLYFAKWKSKIIDWILYATNRNVLELELFFWESSYKFELDQFFTNSCFTHLKLEGCFLNPAGAISWNKLKSLYISGMKLDKDLIRNILSGSPLLETLELRNCYGFRRIDITSKSIKNLVFYVNSGYGVGRMEINAPHIQSLTIQSDVHLCKFLLHDVSTLVKAKLDYSKVKGRRLGRLRAGQYQKIIDKEEEEEQEEVLKGFMLSLRHVKELIMIGKQCIQVLSRLEAKGFVFPSGLRLQDDSDRFRGN